MKNEEVKEGTPVRVTFLSRSGSSCTMFSGPFFIQFFSLPDGVRGIDPPPKSPP